MEDWYYIVIVIIAAAVCTASVWLYSKYTERKKELIRRRLQQGHRISAPIDQVPLTDNTTICFCNCEEPSLKNKVVVITFVSREANDSGYMIALDSVKCGASVIFGCDDAERGREIAEQILSHATDETVTVTSLHVDLKDFQSCRDFATAVSAEVTIINFLVVTAKEFSKQTPSDWILGTINSIWKTNYFGSVIIIKHLLLRVRQIMNSGIIVVSSKDLSGVDLLKVHSAEKLLGRESNSNKDAADYKESKYVLWLYGVYLVHHIREVSQTDERKFSFTMVHTSGVWTTGLELVEGRWKQFKDGFFATTRIECRQTVLHCMRDPTRQDNKCMLKQSTSAEYNQPTRDKIEEYVADFYNVINDYI